MFDIGLGEILLLGVVGLLVFGPDRLPKAAADAGRWVRTLREMAAGARKDIVDSAGIDLDETLGTVRELRDLHPRRLASGLLSDERPGAAPTTRGDGRVGPSGRGSIAPGSAGPGAAAPGGAAFDPDAL